MKYLPEVFYSMPQHANTTMARKDLKELLLNTDGYAFIQGRMYDIVPKHIGAGVYRVTVKDRYKPEPTLKGYEWKNNSWVKKES